MDSSAPYCYTVWLLQDGVALENVRTVRVIEKEGEDLPHPSINNSLLERLHRVSSERSHEVPYLHTLIYDDVSRCNFHTIKSLHIFTLMLLLLPKSKNAFYSTLFLVLKEKEKR